MKRADRSLLTNWWFQIDWRILGPIVIFSMIGLLMGINSVHLIDKWIVFYMAAATIFLFVPMINNKKTIIHLSVLLFVVCCVLLIMTYVDPRIIRGSNRWVHIFGLSLMPADLLKPAFIVLTAWFINKVKSKADDFIGDARLWKEGWWPAYLIIFFNLLAMMFFHPDLGNMFLYMMVFGIMLFWAGAKMKYAAIGGGILGVGVLASMMQPHFVRRIFGGGDDFQTAASLRAIRNGGLWGRNEESWLFQEVPMASTDFIFAGIAEMWGAVAAAAMIGLMMLFFFVLWRRAIDIKDSFSSLVIIGAASIFAIHVVMNVLTGLGLFMKGTTLPFISYGGSSLISFSILFAFVLALVRQDKWGQ